MNVALRAPWTVERFLTWVGRQEGRFEFDGMQPVAMLGGTARHSNITVNIHVALRRRLLNGPYTTFGPDLGIRTEGNAVRFPDVMVVPRDFPGTDRLAPNVSVVFEVLSPDSGRRDRIEKAREYAAVASIRRYIIVETEGAGLQVLHRQSGDDAWTVLTLTGDDTLAMPEVGIEVPVSEIYDGIEFTE